MLRLVEPSQHLFCRLNPRFSMILILTAVSASRWLQQSRRVLAALSAVGVLDDFYDEATFAERAGEQLADVCTSEDDAYKLDENSTMCVSSS